MKKVFGGPNLGKMGSEARFFCHFLKFGSLVFLEIAYDDSLQRCTSSIGKSHENNFLGPNLGQNGPKSGPKLGFLPFSQIWFISFPLNYIG